MELGRAGLEVGFLPRGLGGGRKYPGVGGGRVNLQRRGVCVWRGLPLFSCSYFGQSSFLEKEEDAYSVAATLKRITILHK